MESKESTSRNIKIFDIIQFLILAYSSTRIYGYLTDKPDIFSTDFMTGFFMVLIFFFAGLISKLKLFSRFYEYLSIEMIQGAVLGVGINLYLSKSFDNMNNSFDTTTPSGKLDLIFHYTIPIMTMFLKLIIYRDSKYDTEALKDKKKNTQLLLCINVAVAALIFVYFMTFNKIITIVVAVPLTVLTIFLIYHRNLRKDEKKKLDEYAMAGGYVAMGFESLNEYRRYKVMNKKKKAEFDKILTERLLEREKAYYKRKHEEQNRRQYEQRYERDSGYSNSESVTRNNLVYFSGCSTKEELEQRHKSLAKAFHPDMNGGDEETFKTMEKEYEMVLEMM